MKKSSFAVTVLGAVMFERHIAVYSGGADNSEPSGSEAGELYIMNFITGVVVGGYTKIEDKFVDMYLTKEGESIEEAKERLRRDQK